MKLFRLLCALALFLSAVATPTVTPLAVAQESSSAGTEEDAKLALIIDSSESMQEKDGSGTRLDTAKEVTQEVLTELPHGVSPTLLAYGSRVKASATNRAEGCRDVVTISPSEIDSLEALGYTPIGHSLLKAAEELGTEGKRAIVLVSDGMDTCAPPDVCDVAKDLAKDNVGLAVNIVGFKVDEAARTQLSCITDATSGMYVDAGDRDQLAEALRDLTARAVRGASAQGTPFKLANSPDEAMYLGEGQYQTTAEITHGRPTNDVPHQYFRIGVPEGYVAFVSASPIPDNGAQNGKGTDDVDIVLEAENDSDPECKYHTLGVSERTGEASGTAFKPISSAVTSIEPRDDDCDMDQWDLYFQVYNSATDPKVSTVDIETLIQFEPIPSDAELATMPDGDIGSLAYELQAAPIANPSPATGSPDFNNAPTITPGSYSDSIVPGEYKFYKFPVEWGQNPQVTIETDASVRNEADSIRAQIYSPIRVGVGSAATLNFFDETRIATTKTDRDVNFRNREANTGGWDYSMAGEYYVGISYNTGYEDDAKGLDQPIRFAVTVEGQPGAGPQWRPVHRPGPAPSTSPIYPEGAKEHAQSASPSASVKSSTPETTGQLATALSEHTDNDGKSGFMALSGWLLVLLIALSVPILWWWRKRSRLG